MNLLEELVQLAESKNAGTYVGARFSKETVDKLKQVIKKLKVKNPLPEEKFHTTIIFSKSPFPKNFKPLGKLDTPWEVIPEKFSLFTGKSDKKCLVIEYDCKEQRKRHEHLMKKYDADYPWPEYKMHVTLSYDCGDFDIEQDVKEFIDKIFIDEEYSEPLQLEWLANSDKKDDKD